MDDAHRRMITDIGIDSERAICGLLRRDGRVRAGPTKTFVIGVVRAMCYSLAGFCFSAQPVVSLLDSVGGVATLGELGSSGSRV